MKTALITGSTRGLGLCIANTLSGAGYDLILHCGRSGLNAVLGVENTPISGDLNNQNTIKELAEAAKENDIDILINNAGIHVGGSIEGTTEEQYRSVINTNLIAPIMLTKSIWPIFIAKRSGMVININSMAGQHGGRHETAYSASKFGLRGFSGSLNHEAKENGIQIVDICPGAMSTDMTITRADHENLIAPEEVAQLILTICNGYETMNVTKVDISRRIYH